MINLREKLKKALISHAKGKIDVHIANIDVYLNNPVGIGEHSNVIETIQSELDKIAHYDGQIEMLIKYID